MIDLLKRLIDLITYPIRWYIGHLATKDLTNRIKDDAGSNEDNQL